MELKQFKRTLQQAMVLPIAACLFLAVVLAWQIEQSSSTVKLIENADQRIALATRIELFVVDEETGLRGYQTTSDPRFLDPYYAAQAPMQQAIDTLMRIKTAQPTHLNAFIQLHNTWHSSFVDPLIAMIRAGDHTNDIDLNITGKTSMDSMRYELNEIVVASEQRRANNIEQWDRSKRDEITILIFLALSIGLIIALFSRDRLEAVSSAFLKSLELQRIRTEELFQSEQNLRTTLTSIGDGVITCDVESNIAIMNPVAQELTGWSEAEALKRPLEDIFHIVNETSREPVENPVAKVRRLNRVVGLANHTVLLRKDGSEIAIDDCGAPILNEAGQLTGVVMVFRDVSMERRTRAALLANEKLAVAGRLAATIAHEIHNPLDSVANVLYLLQQDPNGAESKHFLDIAQNELSRVTQISRAMLSLYRESKAPVPVNLKEMIDDLLLLMEGRFNTIGVTASTEVPPKIVVEGFPAELRQVFTNLITNAAEAAGQGGHIKVRVIAQNPGTSRFGEKLQAGATVEIIDDGPGIPLEIRDKLFQPFFTTKGERGTGLGLWVTQGIIRKHAGTIRLDSRTEPEAHGTTASVFLASNPIIDPGGD